MAAARVSLPVARGATREGERGKVPVVFFRGWKRRHGSDAMTDVATKQKSDSGRERQRKMYRGDKEATEDEQKRMQRDKL